MKFNEIPYKRPSLKEHENDFKDKLSKFENATSFEEQDKAFSEIYNQRDDFNTMYQLAGIKYTTDTANKSYEEENNYFDEIMPNNQELINEFYKKLGSAKYKSELAKKHGNFIFTLADNALKGFDPKIVEELKEQNKLSTEYTKLKGTAEIEFEGEKFNLAGIGKFLTDKDRNVRKKASEARWKFFADKQEEFDELYGKLVKIRHKMAVKLGYENFIDLGYIWMGRIDYNKEMVANFRKQIVSDIVPIANNLREKQKRRLGLNKLEEHDLGYHFLSGNPTPKGTPDQILDKAKVMYKELSPETDKFFNHMINHDLLDIKNRAGKADAGYCWELSKYKHPFIFANFNGTSHDVDVLTHEAGHAFQYFCSRVNDVIEYRWPSSESAEIHSMSMEFLTYPWMSSFFEQDADKYFFNHLNGSLLFLPYGCAVDHFQHVIYENPNFTANERAGAWKEMEKMYMPDRDYTGNKYLESGRFWQRQGHIFESPFYYIDYVLAQICAFQFWQKNNKDKKSTWTDYLNLCNAGGTAPFLDLVKIAKLKSPFEDGSLTTVASDIKKHLDSIDDSKF